MLCRFNQKTHGFLTSVLQILYLFQVPLADLENFSKQVVPKTLQVKAPI